MKVKVKEAPGVGVDVTVPFLYSSHISPVLLPTNEHHRSGPWSAQMSRSATCRLNSAISDVAGVDWRLGGCGASGLSRKTEEFEQKVWVEKSRDPASVRGLYGVFYDADVARMSIDSGISPGAVPGLVAILRLAIEQGPRSTSRDRERKSPTHTTTPRHTLVVNQWVHFQVE